MSPPISSTLNGAAMIVPIIDEEAVLLTDEQQVQQETTDLKCLLAKKHKQHEELSDKWKVVQAKQEVEAKVMGRMLTEAVVAEVRWAGCKVGERLSKGLGTEGKQ